MTSLAADYEELNLILFEVNGLEAHIHYFLIISEHVPSKHRYFWPSMSEKFSRGLFTMYGISQKQYQH